MFLFEIIRIVLIMQITLHRKKLRQGNDLRYESENIKFHSRAYETRLSPLSPVRFSSSECRNARSGAVLPRYGRRPA